MYPLEREVALRVVDLGMSAKDQFTASGIMDREVSRLKAESKGASILYTVSRIRRNITIKWVSGEMFVMSFGWIICTSSKECVISERVYYIPIVLTVTYYITAYLYNLIIAGVLENVRQNSYNLRYTKSYY